MTEGTFDLAELARQTADTAELEIEHPATGEATGIRIRLMSADSDVWKKQLMRLRKENVKYRDRRDGVPPEKLAADSISLLVGCTVGWEGLSEGGKPLEFSEANARRVYEDFPFIREQVDAFVGDRRNFINA